VSAAHWTRNVGVFFILTTWPALLRAEPPAEVAVNLGAFQVQRGTNQARVEIGGEVRFSPLPLRLFGQPARLFGWTLPPLTPVVGGSATEKGALYTWAGVRLDQPLSHRMVLSPVFGLGLYSRGYDRDLGGPVELRTGLELSYRLRSGRLGVCLYHLSNSRLYALNPGSESLVVTYSAALH
jgi:hypothetical protein